MAHPGELSGLQKEIKCKDCGAALPLQVCRSNAGHYIGFYCGNCGPCSRETDYYRRGEDADDDLANFLEKNIVPRKLR